MQISLEKALDAALTAEQLNDYKTAEIHYSAIIKAYPLHAEANNNLGLIAIRFGKLRNALTLFSAALRGNPKFEQAWVNLIETEIVIGDLDNALAKLQAASNQFPYNEQFAKQYRDVERAKSSKTIDKEFEGVFKKIQTNFKAGNYEKSLQAGLDLQKSCSNFSNLTNIIAACYSHMNAPESALNNYRQSLLINPAQAHVHFNVGNIYMRRHEYESAAICFRKATDVDLNFAEGHNNLGNALAALGNKKAAVVEYKKAVAIKPNYATALRNLGNTFETLNLIEDATTAYIKALETGIEMDITYCNFGNMHKRHGDINVAIEMYGKALEINPDYVAAHFNIGNAFLSLSRFEEAVEQYQIVVSSNINTADAHNNLGTALFKLGRMLEASACYENALKIQPNYASAELNLSFLKLANGNNREGISLRESRWRQDNFKRYLREFSAPQWDGIKSLKGKRLLVWGEQGPGDMVIWASCFNYFQSLCKEMIIECPKKLVILFQLSFPKTIVREEKPLEINTEDFDYHVPMETLFSYAIKNINMNSHQKAYLFPDLERVKYWHKKLNTLTQKPRIGICWESPLVNEHRVNNYADLSFWEPIFKNSNVTFVNLQSKNAQTGLERIYSEFGVEVLNFDSIDHYDDLAEAGALMRTLNATISIPTAVSTISAAVGTPTIIPTWRQSAWNNVLFNSRGPNLTMIYKDTWNTWHDSFNEIAAILQEVK